MFTYKPVNTPSGPAYRVSGHPDLSGSFTFATVRKSGGRWSVEYVAVKGAERPTETFKTREGAAEAGLLADLAARNRASERRTCERPITLGILNSLLGLASASDQVWVDDLEQIDHGPNPRFRVRYSQVASVGLTRGDGLGVRRERDLSVIVDSHGEVLETES